MATSRSSGFVVTHSIWNALASRLTDDGSQYSGTVTGDYNGGAIISSSTIRERGRSTAIGEWIAVSYASSNFLAAGAGAIWTVESGDIVTNRAAKALAAFEGRTEVTVNDIQRIIALCLRHRLRKDPLESIDSGYKVEKIFCRVFGLPDPEANNSATNGVGQLSAR